VLQTPIAQNPFTGGSPCVALGRTLAPFGGASDKSCTVKPGTNIFVAASSVECSNVEDPPFFGEDEPQLRACAKREDVKVAPIVTVDGKSVPVTEVETPLLNIDLPKDNIFGKPEGTQGLSVGHGWVTLLHPLTPGTHTIVITGAVLPGTFTTTINVVQPGHEV
jgi:hypothetical protein